VAQVEVAPKHAFRVRPKPPEEEPFYDLAQPVLCFLGREKIGAGAWRQCVQYSPEDRGVAGRGVPDCPGGGPERALRYSG
jgi:hypothetical protein